MKIKPHKRLSAFFNLAIVLSALGFAGCASVELSSTGAMKNGDRLLVIENDGYELLWLIPLWSGELTWNARQRTVNCSPVFFRNHSDTQHLYDMARKIAQRENCDLVDVTFIDNYKALNPANFYGAIKANETTVSAILRPRR